METVMLKLSNCTAHFTTYQSGRQHVVFFFLLLVVMLDSRMFRRSMKRTGNPLYSPVSCSLPLPCVTVCLFISFAIYLTSRRDAALLTVSRYVPAGTE